MKINYEFKPVFKIEPGKWARLKAHKDGTYPWKNRVYKIIELRDNKCILTMGSVPADMPIELMEIVLPDLPDIKYCS